MLTVLSGMTYMEHLQDNLRTYSPLEELTGSDKGVSGRDGAGVAALSDHSLQRLQILYAVPYGLDIPGILLHFNKCINEGNMPSSSQDANYRKARRAFLVGYDRSVPRLRQEPIIASAVTSAIPIVRKASTFPRRCSASTNSSKIWKQGRAF